MADNIFWWFICEKQSLSVNQNLAMKICCSWGLVRNNRNYSPIFHPRFVIRFCLRRHSTPRRFLVTTNNNNTTLLKFSKGFLSSLFHQFKNKIKETDTRNKVFSIRIKLHSVIEKTLYLGTIYEGERWWKNDYHQINVNDNSNHFPPLYLRISFARHKMTTITNENDFFSFLQRSRN